MRDGDAQSIVVRLRASRLMSDVAGGGAWLLAVRKPTAYEVV